MLSTHSFSLYDNPQSDHLSPSPFYPQMDRPSGSFGVVGDGVPVDGAVPVGFEYSGGAFHPGSGGGAEGFSSHFSRDEEYKKKREKNNEAVRKSRQKTKNRTMETARRVEALKQVYFALR